MSVLVRPRVGMRVVMPPSTGDVVAVDDMRDRVRVQVAGKSIFVDFSDLFASTPESRDPETIESWLDGPELMLIQAQTVPCRICRYCNRLVVIRGRNITESHTKNPNCGCAPDCACCASDTPKRALAV